MKLQDIDWLHWEAKVFATLLFIIKEDQILLIHKKRGLGAGKVNAPGGHVEPGETPMEGAIREVQEEVCVTPLNIRKCGELYFQFKDGLSMKGFVFSATDFEGVPQETDEALPFWSSIHKIPFNQMWEDDQYWIPLMLEQKYFEGKFIFDGDQMLDHQITI